MLKISMEKVKKYYGTRLLLDIEDLKVYESDRIGIVGANGAGKTTLLEIINKNIGYDSGELFYNKNTVVSYIPQLGGPRRKTIGGKYASIFQVEQNWNDNMSGGEKTRFKLAEGFENSRGLLLVDEPTNNLDIDGIELVINNFKAYKGPFLVVSHDRNFLDKVCNKILEIDRAICKIYNGNYSKYLELKEMEESRKDFEYQEFIKEKNRLTNLKRNVENRSAKVKTTPKRMGNSEARLHKMGGQGNKAKLDSFAKSVEKRIDHLEEKERPPEQDIIKIKVLESSKPYSKILISGKNLNKSYGKNKIFHKADFNINNGKKTALLGPNGSGKTTLINMILGQENINISKNVRIGYFSQSLNNLDEEKTILENVMEGSIHDQGMARLILGRLLIKGDRVFEKLGVLSGGERVKVSFAKIILGDINFLVLDEPTNYLDIGSLGVIEELLKNYDGSILLVSHDIRFIENVCDELLIIDNKKIKSFRGSYGEYITRQNKKQVSVKEKDIEDEVLLIKNQLSTLLGKISTEQNEDKKAEYDLEYNLRLEELQSLYKK